MEHLLGVLTELLETKTSRDISTYLNISKSTLLRWLELQRVPNNYRIELLKLANKDIDYSTFSFKEKDQFYTSIQTVNYCLSVFHSILSKYGDNESDYVFIEPSAGKGNFLKALPENRRIGMDIEPTGENVIQQDYLSWTPEITTQKYVVIGNPPFGLRGQLALKFINRSSHFADYVCFILPQLFESDGKGVPRKRVQGFQLVHSEKLQKSQSCFEYPDGKSVNVECIFQVWSKYHTNPDFTIKATDTSIIKVYSLSDGGTPSTTRNKNMLYSCHIYLPSTCFGKENMRYHESFNELPRKKGYGIVFRDNISDYIQTFKSIDWSEVAFLSTNSAYNIRTSQIIQKLLEG